MIAIESRRIDLPASPAELDEPGWDDGALYLLVDAPKPAGTWFGPSRLKADHPVGLVHVMSRAHGGEVRGYWIVDGALELRHPVTPLRWFTVDNAVSRALGMLVVDYGAPECSICRRRHGREIEHACE